MSEPKFHRGDLVIISPYIKGQESTFLGSTWSNMFSILLTNSFSIIGTIMGVKYASEKSEKTD